MLLINAAKIQSDLQRLLWLCCEWKMRALKCTLTYSFSCLLRPFHWSVYLCFHATSRVEACCCLEKMVGLRNCSTWEPLLLKASCIKSCANGCSLGITAHLTYANADIESVEGEWWEGAPLERVMIINKSEKGRKFMRLFWVEKNN